MAIDDFLTDIIRSSNDCNCENPDTCNLIAGVVANAVENSPKTITQTVLDSVTEFFWNSRCFEGPNFETVHTTMKLILETIDRLFLDNDTFTMLMDFPKFLELFEIIKRRGLRLGRVSMYYIVEHIMDSPDSYKPETLMKVLEHGMIDERILEILSCEGPEYNIIEYLISKNVKFSEKLLKKIENFIEPDIVKFMVQKGYKMDSSILGSLVRRIGTYRTYQYQDVLDAVVSILDSRVEPSPNNFTQLLYTDPNYYQNKSVGPTALNKLRGEVLSLYRLYGLKFDRDMVEMAIQRDIPIYLDDIIKYKVDLKRKLRTHYNQWYANILYNTYTQESLSIILQHYDFLCDRRLVRFLSMKKVVPDKDNMEKIMKTSYEVCETAIEAGGEVTYECFCSYVAKVLYIGIVVKKCADYDNFVEEYEKEQENHERIREGITYYLKHNKLKKGLKWDPEISSLDYYTDLKNVLFVRNGMTALFTNSVVASFEKSYIPFQKSYKEDLKTYETMVKYSKKNNINTINVTKLAKGIEGSLGGPPTKLLEYLGTVDKKKNKDKNWSLKETKKLLLKTVLDKKWTNKGNRNMVDLPVKFRKAIGIKKKGSVHISKLEDLAKLCY